MSPRPARPAPHPTRDPSDTTDIGRSYIVNFRFYVICALHGGNGVPFNVTVINEPRAWSAVQASVGFDPSAVSWRPGTSTEMAGPSRRPSAPPYQLIPGDRYNFALGLLVAFGLATLKNLSEVKLKKLGAPPFLKWNLNAYTTWN